MKKSNKWVALVLVAVLVCGAGMVQDYVMWQTWARFTHAFDKDSERVETVVDEKPVATATCDPDQLLRPDETGGNTVKASELNVTEPVHPIALEGITMEKLYGDDPVEALKQDTSYTLVLSDLPAKFMDTGNQKVTVTYPAAIPAGGVGKFQVLMEVDGQYYRATLDMIAQDDVRLIHGSDSPNTYSGGEFDYNERTGTLKLNFYSSATARHVRRPSTAGRHSVDGHLSVDYIRVTGLQ